MASIVTTAPVTRPPKITIRRTTAKDLNLNPEKRIGKAEELRTLGHTVSWQDHTYLELIDMVNRIKKAEELHALGYAVDWQSHSYQELVELVGEAQRRSR